jgi:hypothetical protein
LIGLVPPDFLVQLFRRSTLAEFWRKSVADITLANGSDTNPHAQINHGVVPIMAPSCTGYQNIAKLVLTGPDAMQEG